MDTDVVSRCDEIILRHYDAQGRAKLIWQENKIHRWLLSRGILRPDGIKVPLLLGRWATFKKVKL